jgi:hypothetical protein
MAKFAAAKGQVVGNLIACADPSIRLTAALPAPSDILLRRQAIAQTYWLRQDRIQAGNRERLPS